MGSEGRPAFYALNSGGWRDYVTLLHPPYTAWHLSYVAIGWASTPRVYLDRLLACLIAFFLAMGVGAHALDEIKGRPLGTAIASPVLWMLAAVSITAACGIGLLYASEVSWSIGIFVAAGAFLVTAYNLELFGGYFHTQFWFAAAWGAFPAFVAAWTNVQGLSPGVLLVCAGCFCLSLAQRTLSAPVRDLRRRTASVEGTIKRLDGSVVELNASLLRRGPEIALRWFALGIVLLACALVLVRIA